MPRLLISGGAGFLGSHICDYHLKRDYEVVCVDNLLTGSLENIAHLRNNPRFSFLAMRAEDVRPASLPRSQEKLDRVFHFASPASPEYYLKYPLETLSVGSEGTRAMLQVACRYNARFLLASTSEVYGDPHQHPQKEDYWGNVNSVGPRSVYDEAKRYAEALTMAYRRHEEVDTRIVRIFNTYGPRMQGGDGRVIPNFITQALEGKPLTIFGKGEQTRSFCYYEDLIQGLDALVQWGNEKPTNIGNPHEFTMLELANMVLQLTGSSSVLEHRPLPEDDPQRRRPDISRARDVLRWEPKVSLREGLLETIEWFKVRSAAQRQTISQV